MNSINNAKLLMLSFLLFSISSVHAVFESITKIDLKSEKAESVALVNLGNLHDIDEKTDARDKKILFESLENWAQEPEKTLFILESSQDFFQGNEKTFEKFKKMGSDRYVGMYYALARFAHQHNFHYKNIDFVFGDIRGFGTMQLLLFFTALYNKDILHAAFNGALEHELCTPKSVEEMFMENMQLKEHFFFSKQGGIQILYKIYSEMGSTTIATLLQEIDQNMQSIAQFRDSFPKNSAVYTIMHNFYQHIADYAHQAQQFIHDTIGNDTSLICPHLFLKALEKKQSFAYVVEQFDNWVHPLNLAIADAGFMMHILKNINTYKRIVIFSGNNHTIVINNSFLKNEALKKELNSIVSFQQGLTTHSARYSGSRFQEQGLRDLFAKTFSAQNTSKNSASFRQSDLRLCFYCKAPETLDKKLLRCTQCTYALYCNTTCQRNHWPQHKVVCKKQNIEPKKSEETTQVPAKAQELENKESAKQEIITQPQSSVFSWIAEHPLESIIGSGILLGFGYWLLKPSEK